MTARRLISVDDLPSDDITWILRRAGEFASGARPARRAFTAALLFLSSSLRTKLGFGTAVARLGGSAIDVSERRWDPKMSGAESFEDTLRTVTGMVDVTIVRAAVDLSAVMHHAVGPVICGGDLRSHPTQALIDVFAIERLWGPLENVRLAMVGDMQMRASRSLLALLSRRPPAELMVVAPPSRSLDVDISPDLTSRLRNGSLDDLAGVDVVLMCGLAPSVGTDQLSDEARQAFVLDGRHLHALSPSSIVLSPLPVIDEMSSTARLDPRTRMFEQSDMSVHVRAAVVESMIG